MIKIQQKNKFIVEVVDRKGKVFLTGSATHLEIIQKMVVLYNKKKKNELVKNV